MKKQKEKLLKLKLELLNKIKSIENIHISAEDTREEGDLAQAIIGQNVSFELKERELRRLRHIDKALERIDFRVRRAEVGVRSERIERRIRPTLPQARFRQ